MAEPSCASAFDPSIASRIAKRNAKKMSCPPRQMMQTWRIPHKRTTTTHNTDPNNPNYESTSSPSQRPAPLKMEDCIQVLEMSSCAIDSKPTSQQQKITQRQRTTEFFASSKRTEDLNKNRKVARDSNIAQKREGYPNSQIPSIMSPSSAFHMTSDVAYPSQVTTTTTTTYAHYSTGYPIHADPMMSSYRPSPMMGASMPHHPNSIPSMKTVTSTSHYELDSMVFSMKERFFSFGGPARV